jgi:hypothetical protein
VNDTETKIRAEQTAPPRPDFTVNQDFTVRAVLPGSPAEPGYRQSWWVAAERASDGAWVTWAAYRNADQGGKLSYDGGHYETVRSAAENKDRALADLAVRAGLMPGVAREIAWEVLSLTHAEPEDKRMGHRLLRWAGGA